MSNWQGKVSRSKFQAMRDAGYELLIVGTQDGTITRAQLDAGLSVGLRAEAYLWKGWPDDPELQMWRELSRIAGYQVKRVWLDVEEAEDAPPAPVAVREIRKAVEYCQALGYEVGIYTSVSKWLQITGNSSEFADLPLWAAFYGTDFAIENWGGPFGGWTRCFMRQFAGDVDLCGVRVDKSVFRTAA